MEALGWRVAGEGCGAGEQPGVGRGGARSRSRRGWRAAALARRTGQIEDGAAAADRGGKVDGEGLPRAGVISRFGAEERREREGKEIRKEERWEEAATWEPHLAVAHGLLGAPQICLLVVAHEMVVRHG